MSFLFGGLSRDQARSIFNILTSILLLLENIGYCSGNSGIKAGYKIDFIDLTIESKFYYR